MKIFAEEETLYGALNDLELARNYLDKAIHMIYIALENPDKMNLYIALDILMEVQGNFLYKCEKRLAEKERSKQNV